MLDLRYSGFWNYYHEDGNKDDYLIWREDDVSESPNDPDIPQNASYVSCVKEDKNEGERERRIERGEKRCGKSGGDTRRNDEHKGGKRNQGNQFYQ